MVTDIVFDISDFTKNVEKAFNAAHNEEVIVNNKDGNSYKIFPIKNNVTINKSPLEDIPFITANVTTQEIVEIIRESRAGL